MAPIVEFDLVRRIRDFERDRPATCVFRYPENGSTIVKSGDAYADRRAYLILKGEVIECVQRAEHLSMTVRTLHAGNIIFPQALDHRFAGQPSIFSYRISGQTKLLELNEDVASLLLGFTPEIITRLAEAQHSTSVAFAELVEVYECDFGYVNQDLEVANLHAKELKHQLDEAHAFIDRQKREMHRLEETFCTVMQRLETQPALELTESIIPEEGDDGEITIIEELCEALDSLPPSDASVVEPVPTPTIPIPGRASEIGSLLPSRNLGLAATPPPPPPVFHGQVVSQPTQQGTAPPSTQRNSLPRRVPVIIRAGADEDRKKP